MSRGYGPKKAYELGLVNRVVAAGTVFGSRDAVEGPRAFAQKREPR
ncbi:hypothetical protein KIH74_21660 [Kineosporia sp. J2-2]|uniref:Uncharacterized protein n=1 Tax=Kineosporia corallincola TaxID=2835133 RepID=A0ABS5TKD7_9ACTN|nr:hypothetical protein [Kineosporia corallincola]MBT0771560.1 hypothetical protein [Kineosporia corallincola]